VATFVSKIVKSKKLAESKITLIAGHADRWICPDLNRA
jgi:hypothetical protein